MKSINFLYVLAGLLFVFTGQGQAAEAFPKFTELVKQESPAVVNISTTQKATRHPAFSLSPHGIPNMPSMPNMPDIFKRFFDERQSQPDSDLGNDYESESLGSGFIISEDGYILTNHHVVEDATKIIVRLSDRSEIEAVVVGTDKRSDIALLKIDKKGLPTVSIGDPSTLEVGEWVLAIGSPFGFDHSVTAGIVSAKQRALPSENYVPFIQTDVAINPGNSGGPLFNMQGQVVGVNSQIYSRTGGYMGLSFAVPIDMAMNVVEQLRDNGRVARGWLGVLIQDITRDLAESFNMERPVGALVAKVFPRSPSEKAGFQVGDVIIEFNHQEVMTSSALPPLVGRTPVDKNVPVKILRDGAYKTLHVTLGELPEETSLAQKKTRDDVDQDTMLVALGLNVEPLSEPQKNSDAGNADGSTDKIMAGVVVSRIDSGPAKKAGLKVGDIILKMNNKQILSVAQFKDVAGDLPTNKSIALLIKRQDGPLFLALKLHGK